MPFFPPLDAIEVSFFLQPLFSGDQQEAVPFVIGSEQT